MADLINKSERKGFKLLAKHPVLNIGVILM
jgi:hypothetical protein